MCLCCSRKLSSSTTREQEMNEVIVLVKLGFVFLSVVAIAVMYVAYEQSRY